MRGRARQRLAMQAASMAPNNAQRRRGMRLPLTTIVPDHTHWRSGLVLGCLGLLAFSGALPAKRLTVHAASAASFDGWAKPRHGAKGRPPKILVLFLTFFETHGILLFSAPPSRREMKARLAWKDWRQKSAQAAAQPLWQKEGSGSACARRGSAPGAGRIFFLGIARNPLKSPELDEGIQENPRKSKQNSKGIQENPRPFSLVFFGFSWSWVRLGVIWPQALTPVSPCLVGEGVVSRRRACVMHGGGPFEVAL